MSLFAGGRPCARCALIVEATRDGGLAYLMGTIESIVRDRLPLLGNVGQFLNKGFCAGESA
jgi:hypothetical protein